jgi:hypothetical protein
MLLTKGKIILHRLVKLVGEFFNAAALEGNKAVNALNSPPENTVIFAKTDGSNKSFILQTVHNTNVTKI